MILNVQMQGAKEAGEYFVDMASRTPQEIKMMLDRLSTETKGHMKDVVPQGRTGNLKDSIVISSPASYTRVIGPTVRYAAAVETGTSNYGSLPNLQNIADYYGFSLFTGNQQKWLNPVVLALAKKIRDSGTTAKLFVESTYEWILGQFESHAYSFLNNLVRG